MNLLLSPLRASKATSLLGNSRHRTNSFVQGQQGRIRCKGIGILGSTLYRKHWRTFRPMSVALFRGRPSFSARVDPFECAIPFARGENVAASKYDAQLCPPTGRPLERGQTHTVGSGALRSLVGRDQIRRGLECDRVVGARRLLPSNRNSIAPRSDTRARVPARPGCRGFDPPGCGPRIRGRASARLRRPLGQVDSSQARESDGL